MTEYCAMCMVNWSSRCLLHRQTLGMYLYAARTLHRHNSLFQNIWDKNLEQWPEGLKELSHYKFRIHDLDRVLSKNNISEHWIADVPIIISPVTAYNFLILSLSRHHCCFIYSWYFFCFSGFNPHKSTSPTDICNFHFNRSSFVMFHPVCIRLIHMS